MSKLSEVRELVFQAQHGYCKLCICHCTELHHRLPNTKTNRKLFPLFIDSPFNLYGVDKNCHLSRKKEMNIPEDEAMLYESWLDNFAIMCYTLGKEDKDGTDKISLQELRERIKLRFFSDKALSE